MTGTIIKPTDFTQPLKWHGGKAYLAAKYWSLVDEAKLEFQHVVEPYFGGGAFTLHGLAQGRPLSFVANDTNLELTDFWRCLADPIEFSEFKRIVDCIPMSEYEWRAAIGFGGEFTRGRVAKAVAFFVKMRQSRQGIGKSFATLSKTRVRRGMNEQASSWLSAVDGLPDVHEMIRPLVVLNSPALDVIRREDTETTLHYLDPPYLPSTRRKGANEYGPNEMSYEQHAELLAVAGRLKGRMMLSGYPSPLYDEYAARMNWRHVDFNLPNNASSAASKERKTERVWLNF